MRKRLLLAVLAIVSAMSSFAYESGDYIFTATSRLKLTSGNLVQNGSFTENPATTGWTDATGADINAEVWDFIEGEGPNGENFLTSRSATADAALCNAWEVQAGTTYVVTYDIKGPNTGTTVIKAGENNYADFFLNDNASLIKEEGNVQVAAVDGYLGNEWKTVSFIFTPTTTTYLCMHFEKFVTDVSVTNFGLYEATEVYDTRDLRRKMDYANQLLAMDGVDTNADEGAFAGIVSVINTFLAEENHPALDDKAGIEAMLTDYNQMLLNFLNLNSTDLLANEKRWSAYGDTRKFNDIGNWKGSGGRWFHKNNGGGDGDEIGHRLQGGMAAGSASMHYTVTPALPGNYMFSVETQGYYMAGSTKSSGCSTNQTGLLLLRALHSGLVLTYCGPMLMLSRLLKT